MPEAAEEVRIFFEWGNNPSKNRYELSAGLIGHIKNNTFIIEALIPLNLKKRNEDEAALSEKNYDELINKLKIMNECRMLSDEKYRFFDGDYRLVGIVHTHPNGLKSTMSPPDMRLHKRMLDLHTEFVSVVLNPQVKIIRAYFNLRFIAL